jgi:hypothetical protein
MITRQDIQSVLNYHGPSMLSVYLDIDPSKPENLGTTRAFQIWLKNALREVENEVADGEKPAFREQAARVQDFVNKTSSQGKSLAIFAGSNHWQAYHLPVPLANRAAWGRPEVGPLLCQIHSYRPYGVILVDHERARFFVVEPDDAHECMDLILPLDTSDWGRKGVVPPSDPGGMMTSGIAGSNLDAFQHRIDAQVHRFYGRVAEGIPNLIENHGADGLILGGPEEPVAELQALLPPNITAEVLATLPIRVEASPAEVRELTAPVVMQRREEREVKLVTELIDRALGNGPAVLGLESTLRHLQAGQVYTVVTASDCVGVDRVGADHDLPLRHCPNCDFTTSSLQRNECPVCGTAMKKSSLAAMLPALAEARGSEIRIVRGQATELLAPFEGIGALLRF